MLSAISILTTPKQTHNTTNGINYMQVLETLPIAKLTSYFTTIVQTITTVSGISSLQHLLYDQHIRNKIVTVMSNTSIIGLNNYSDLNSELLAIN